MFYFCSMVRTVSLLSEDAPESARNAGLGYRYRYWRGASGRRYLFTAIPSESLADFRSVVVIQAEPVADGRLRARAVYAIGEKGETDGVPPRKAPGDKVFVHFLAASEEERRRIIEDLAAVQVRLAA
jgi:hypothetical protein